MPYHVTRYQPAQDAPAVEADLRMCDDCLRMAKRAGWWGVREAWIASADLNHEDRCDVCRGALVRRQAVKA